MIEIKTLASGSSGNCYFVTDGVTPLILECGIRFKDIQKALDFKTSNLSGCLVSHEHKDHTKGLKDVVRAGIDCYMSQGTADAEGLEHHRIKVVENKVQFKIGTWTILPFDLQHHAAEPFGFLPMNDQGHRLLSVTDTSYVRCKFSGLIYIMVERNYAIEILVLNIEHGIVPQVMKKRVVKSHFSLENGKEFLMANDLSNVQEIHLIHLSNNNGDPERFKREVQELTGKIVYVS